jgi:hypothetical protein
LRAHARLGRTRRRWWGRRAEALAARSAGGGGEQALHLQAAGGGRRQQARDPVEAVVQQAGPVPDEGPGPGVRLAGGPEGCGGGRAAAVRRRTRRQR